LRKRRSYRPDLLAHGLPGPHVLHKVELCSSKLRALSWKEAGRRRNRRLWRRRRAPGSGGLPTTRRWWPPAWPALPPGAPGRQNGRCQADALRDGRRCGQRDQGLVFGVYQAVDDAEAGERTRVRTPGPIQHQRTARTRDRRRQPYSDIHSAPCAEVPSCSEQHPAYCLTIAGYRNH
jgi:hypothetical protein